MSDPVLVGGATPAAGNKRLLVLGGVAAALLLLALVVPKVLFGGDDLAVEELPTAPVTAPVDGTAVDPVVPGKTAATDPDAEPAMTFEVFSTKNPFTPLRDLTPASSATGDATTVAPATGTDPTTTPTTPATPGTGTGTVVPSASTSPTTVTPSVEPVSGQRVALLEVFVDDASRTVATVRVNDTVHEVAQGAAFASRYKAVTLSVADGCGQFLYGDADFRLCEGEELLK